MYIIRMMNLISDYLNRLASDLRQGNATEHTHRPALKSLLESLQKDIRATNEPKHIECGAPDFVIIRRVGENSHVLGYIESKDVGDSLDKSERSDQLRRYLRSIDNLILTDYLEFRWYVSGE